MVSLLWLGRLAMYIPPYTWIKIPYKHKTVGKARTEYILKLVLKGIIGYSDYLLEMEIFKCFQANRIFVCYFKASLDIYLKILNFNWCWKHFLCAFAIYFGDSSVYNQDIIEEKNNWIFVRFDIKYSKSKNCYSFQH